MTTFIKHNLMKIIYLPFLLICLLFSACSPGNLGYTDAMERNERKLESEGQRKDAQFLVEATDYNILLKKLSEEASQKAYSRVVSEFANENLQDHMAMNNKLREMAKDKKLAIPSNIENRHENILRDIEKADKRNIDKIYLNAIEILHTRMLRLYEEAALNANDDDVRAYAAAQLETLRSHNKQADEIRRELI